ncbi:MAG: ABC transporter permease, partial [Pseudomonadota bacterium]
MTMLTSTATIKQHSYAVQVLQQVFHRYSARFGLGWIVVLAFFAAFAPFLASSHPLLLSEDGQLRSPLFSHLTTVDIILPSLFCASVVLLWLRRTWLFNIATLFCVFALTGVLGSLFLDPPKLTIYEQYRENLAAEKYDWIIFAPIPYSPKDYLRDKGDTALESP